MERLAASKLSKRRKDELADCYNLNKSDPEYEVFKKGNTFYISKRDQSFVEEPVIKETIEDSIKPAKSKKTKTNNIDMADSNKSESFTALLDHVIQLHQHVARIDKRHKKHKGKFNKLHDDLYSSVEAALAEEHEVEQNDSKSEEHSYEQSQVEPTPKFGLRRRC